MDRVLKQEYMLQVQDMINVTRQLTREGEISLKQHKVINKHLGALKSVLKDDFNAPNSYQLPKQRYSNNLTRHY